jgi:hypothetical protein
MVSVRAAALSTGPEKAVGVWFRPLWTGAQAANAKAKKGSHPPAAAILVKLTIRVSFSVE